MSMGGGSGGGSVVQQTAPWAANQAGMIGSMAALQAGQVAAKSLTDAMGAINQSYISASKSIQPYTQEGLQSLDKLNSYIGLAPVNPGAAPDVPVNKLGNPIYATSANGKSGLVGYDDPTFQKLYHSALSLAPNQPGNVAPGTDQAHVITSVAQQLMGKSNPTVGEQNFLSQFMGTMGGPGEVGKDFLTDFAQPYNDQFTQDTKLYNLDKENYDYSKGLYDQYTASGPMSADDVYNDITSQPGYSAQLNQGIDAIQKSGSASGYLGSGRVLKELNTYGQNTLSQFYNNTLTRLQQLAGSGQQAATTQAGLASNQGNSLASLYSSIGDAQANALLTSANARSQALVAANQQFSTVGGGGGSGAGIGQAIGAIGSIASAFSAKQLKEGFKKINTADILKQVNQLDIEKWKYKELATEHLGCYAGQFKEVFGVGDGNTINLIDCVGILMASVQELTKKLDDITKEISHKEVQ